MDISKKELRIQSRTLALSPEKVYVLIAHIVDSELFQNARNICIYKNIAGEIPTDQLIETSWKTGKNVYIPHIHWETKHMHMCKYTAQTTLKTEQYGLVAPTVCNKAETIDLIIVPCRMIAKDGTRLGTGGGYYDRFLAQTHVAVRIGVSLYPVIPETLPKESHDVKMTHVTTVEGVVEALR